MVQTIKILIALTGLALLSACWGLKRPSPVTSTIELCTTNPFQGSCDETYEIERIVKITECIARDAAATPTCADAVEANSCIRDPFVTACATDDSFSPYLARARSARVTYCATDNANATLCAGVAGSVQLDNECLDSPVGDPANASCATRPSVVRICADAPFTRPGCGNVSTIDALRIAHCDDPLTAWDDGCVEATYTGATAARNMACLEYGIDADAGGHADCAMRGNVLAACGDNTLFAHDVCDAVEGNGVKQINACLADVDADDRCVALIMQTCEDTPLAGVSCAGLDGHAGFLDAFCAKDDNAMIGGCATTPAGLCFADPFGDMVTDGDGTIDCLADDDYDSARQARCAAGTEGSGECDTAVIAPAVCASSGANANPFVAFCLSATMIGGNDAIADIRQAVVTLCLNGANPAMAVCVNTNTVVSALTTGGTRCELAGHAFTDRCAYTQFNDERIGFCPVTAPFAYAGCDDVAGITGKRQTFCRDTTANDGANPFDSNCTGGLYSNVTNTQRDACLDNAVAPDNSCATNSAAKTYCETNDPLSKVGCVNLTEYLAVVRTYCGNNADEATCKANYADWNGSFTGNDVLATAPVSTHTTNRFLSGLTATALTGFTLLTTSETNGQKANATTSLNLADADHGFGGQAEDGLAFYGVIFSGNIRYYAGIYTTTDLGAPLTDASKNGVWEAWMRTSGKDPDSEGFELTVSFTESSKEGTLTAFFQSTSGANTALYYDINGRFGVNGVITGSVAIGTEDSNNSGSILASGDEYTLGKLTGLIGTEGVVAAFVSNTSTITADGNGDGINPFVGGFVAAPLVTYADWNLAATPEATLDTPIANQFLADVVTNGGAGVTSVTLDSAQYNSTSLGGEATDGFAYNTAGTTPDFVYYVGLLPSTDLGLPLVAQPTGTWNGSFVSIEGGTVATTDFTLTVTYGGATGSNAGSVASSAAIGNYNFTGEFDARGVIIGTITHTVTSPASTSMGTLQGLIGQDGAVGVFISNAGEGVDYGGGFVARKP